MHYSFQQDLAEGELAEGEVLERLKPHFRGSGYFPVESKHEKSHDLKFVNPFKGKKFLVEIKWDQYSQRSGNIAIEFKCSDLWSGIVTTEAKVWVFKYWNDDGWRYRAVETSFLYEQYRGKHWRTTYGGDHNNARMILVPVAVFETWGVRL